METKTIRSSVMELKRKRIVLVNKELEEARMLIDLDISYAMLLLLFRRRHQSLDERTPDEVYWTMLPQRQVAV
jgi:hypothetical protein